MPDLKARIVTLNNLNNVLTAEVHEVEVNGQTTITKIVMNFLGGLNRTITIQDAPESRKEMHALAMELRAAFRVRGYMGDIWSHLLNGTSVESPKEVTATKATKRRSRPRQN